MFNISETDTFHSTSYPADDRNPFFRAVRQNILDKVFDFIIVGSGHRAGTENVLHFWSEICKTYGNFEVICLSSIGFLYVCIE